MSDSLQRKAPTGTTPDSDLEAPTVSKDAQKIKDDIDGLLDEIDEVLETNAEEFVKNYVQKGGE